jgi:hypothetical protein
MHLAAALDLEYWPVRLTLDSAVRNTSARTITPTAREEEEEEEVDAIGDRQDSSGSVNAVSTTGQGPESLFEQGKLRVPAAAIAEIVQEILLYSKR